MHFKIKSEVFVSSCDCSKEIKKSQAAFVAVWDLRDLAATESVFVSGEFCLNASENTKEYREPFAQDNIVQKKTGWRMRRPVDSL